MAVILADDVRIVDHHPCVGVTEPAKPESDWHLHSIHRGFVPAVSGPTVSAVPQSVSIPAGTTLTIRIDQHISVKTRHAGDLFSGELVDPVLASDNSVLVPKGALVGGVVDVSHRRGHFKGRSLLELRLTSLTLNGTEYPLTTPDLTRSKKGKGRRSAALIAGGSGMGMLVGGLASGGVGLVVGGVDRALQPLGRSGGTAGVVAQHGSMQRSIGKRPELIGNHLVASIIGMKSVGNRGRSSGL